MGARLLSTQATILHREASGDDWLRLRGFSVEHGRLECLLRLARRTAASTPMLDLFDDVQLSLESRNEGRIWFVKEAGVLHRRSGLGRSYAALRLACRFATLLQENPVPEESRVPVFELLQRALAAWERGSRPEIVYFKSLYLLARDEGYPVAQDWRARLPGDERSRVASLLRLTADEQSLDEVDVANLTRDLETYLRHHTEIRVGA